MTIETTALSILAVTLFKEPAANLGALLGDKIKEYQINNQISLILRVRKRCKESGIDDKPLLKVLGDRFGWDLLDAAKNHNEEELQEMWSSLLVGAISGKFVHPAYINVIKDLTSVEVKIINHLYKANGVDTREDFFKVFDDHLMNSGINDIDQPDRPRTIILQNLNRLNLINMGNGGASFGSGHPPCLTEFGKTFISVCSCNKVV